MAAGHVVAGQQLGRPPGVLVALGIAPALLLGVRGLVAIVLGDIVEHETLALLVPQHTAFAPHSFGHQDPAHAGWPDHAGGMKLHELHVLERGPGMVGERVAIPGVLPAVAGDGIGASDSSGCEHDGLGAEQAKSPALAVVAERAGHAATIGQELEDGALHVHVDPLMDAVVL